MSGSLNKVFLLGRLGRDPEGINLKNGGRVVNISVATSEVWKDKQTNARRERTEWHRVVIFNEPLGKIAESYLRKGSEVYIEGELQTRKWLDKSGSERHTTEIVVRPFRGELKLIGGKPEQSDSYSQDDTGYEQNGQTQQPYQTQAQPITTQTNNDDISDDIPF